MRGCRKSLWNPRYPALLLLFLIPLGVPGTYAGPALAQGDASGNQAAPGQSPNPTQRIRTDALADFRRITELWASRDFDTLYEDHGLNASRLFYPKSYFTQRMRQNPWEPYQGQGWVAVVKDVQVIARGEVHITAAVRLVSTREAGRVREQIRTYKLFKEDDRWKVNLEVFLFP